MITSTALHEVLHEEARIKRFFERWTADPRFRDALRERPAQALAEVEDALEPAQLTPILEQHSGEVSNSEAMFEWQPMQRVWKVARIKAEWIRSFYMERAVPAHPTLKGWRERQIRRQVHDLGPFHASSNIHSSLSIELSSGCSVGCWFCALSPESLNGVFEWTNENESFFTNMLHILSGPLGTAIGSGFLYWATDPLDNPDYERFCEAFHQVTGVFPPTTTARHLVDVERTRRLLALAEANGCWLNRFSVLSRAQMARTHKTFTARELALVECLPLNREAGFAYGNAGRFRDEALKKPELLEEERKKLATAPWHAGDSRYRESDEYANGTIGCVTGLVINLVRRTVELISPCTADDRWPLGSIVFAQASYDDIEGFQEAIERIYGGLRSQLRDEDVLRFAQPLRYEPTARGFRLVGRFETVEEFSGDDEPAAIRALGTAVAEGGWSVERLCAASPLSRSRVEGLLAEFLDRGLLAEEAFDG